MESLEDLAPSGTLSVVGRTVFHNCRTYHWADGSRTVTVCDRAVFRASGWEQRPEKYPPLPPLPDEVKESDYVRAEYEGKFLSDGVLPPRDRDNLLRSVRRAKAKVSALARANVFSHFVTLTFSPEKVDRYDDQLVLRKVNNWLRNSVSRDGLCYVLVPERHKDGAIHFHGFVNDSLSFVDSGTVIRSSGGRPTRPSSEAERTRILGEGGHVVFNIPEWTMGFSTAIRLYGEYSSAVGYVCKYIGKSVSGDAGMPERIGGRWYYSGGALSRPSPVLSQVDYTRFVDLFPGWDFSVSVTGDRYHVVEIGPDGVVKEPITGGKGGKSCGRKKGNG